MANAGSNPGDVFDVRKIRRLVELMKEHDLRQLDLQQGEQRIQLMRGVQPGEVAMAAPVAAPAPAAVPAAAPAAAATEAVEENVAYIVSPMVGTYYEAANPEASPFVAVGDQVGPETTVCIIEAMKVFNEIPAEISGKVVEVLVKNGDPVDVNRKLFKVSTA